MNKDEILKKARSEKKSNKGDERQKVIFDKSFYWAFIGMLVCVFSFSFIRCLKGEPDFESPCTISFTALCAFTYRFIRDRKVRDLVCMLCTLVCFGFVLYRYIVHL